MGGDSNKMEDMEEEEEEDDEAALKELQKKMYQDAGLKLNWNTIKLIYNAY